MENRIREIRQSIGMTLQQVAERAGTTKAQVMKLEKGDRRLTDTWMVRLSLAMSCDPKELMGTIRDSRHLPEDGSAEGFTSEGFSGEEFSGEGFSGSNDMDQQEQERPASEPHVPEVPEIQVNAPQTNEPELINMINPQISSPASNPASTPVKSPVKSQASTSATISSITPSATNDPSKEAGKFPGNLPEEKPKKLKIAHTIKNKPTPSISIAPIDPKTISNVKGSSSTGSLRKARAPKGAPTAAPGCDPVAEIAVRGGMGGGGEAAVSYSPDGSGGMAIADDVKGNWFLPSEYLRSELSVSPAAARIIEVQGDSMTPTLHSGDRVMIDTNDKRPSPPGIFALWDGIGVVVKRLEHLPNSDPALLRISSDNDKHCEYQRTFEEVNIIGRVIWYGRRV